MSKTRSSRLLQGARPRRCHRLLRKLVPHEIGCATSFLHVSSPSCCPCTSSPFGPSNVIYQRACVFANSLAHHAVDPNSILEGKLLVDHICGLVHVLCTDLQELDLSCKLFFSIACHPLVRPSEGEYVFDRLLAACIRCCR